MALGQRRDPYLAFNFLVEIDSLIVGGFSEVTGLQIETVTETYREGGLNEYEHKLAGPTRYPANLVLKRGLTDAETLWNWHQAVTRGIVQRKNISIVLRDSAGNEAWRWNVAGAYPVKWTGPDLRGDNALVAVETVEFVHRGLTKATG